MAIDPGSSPALDWSRWPNFREAEFRCRCGACDGALVIEPRFLDRLQRVRSLIGLAMPVTSGYRCANHPEERRKKAGPGAHHFGVAADIACDGRGAFLILREAPRAGMTGIGVAQRAGQPRFIHLDCHDHPARPNVWSY